MTTSLAAISIDALAVTPQQAQQLLRWGNPTADVALIDVSAPADVELVRRFASTMPVLALGLQVSTGQAAKDAGASGFHEKDGDSDALLALLRAVCAFSDARAVEPTDLPKKVST